jgi:hypothetical protein
LNDENGIMIATRLVVCLAIAATVVSSTLSAQSSGTGFLFGEPKGSIVFRGGYALATANSDLFSFTANRLTLDRRAFSSPAVDIDLALQLAPRTDIVLAVSYAGVNKGSEFRDFVDQSDNPIQQTTTFQRVPVTVGVREYLMSRGRAVGNFAWIPARFAPYAGVGAGMMWYRFRQNGDFVDFDTNDVFTARLVSSGWTPAASATAGAVYTVSPRLALTGQGSFLWARGRLGGDFSGFNRIDLSGLSATAGLLVRF